MQRIEQSRPVFAQAMQREHGVSINPGPFGIDSRPALVMAKHAEANNAGEAYHSAVYEAYWVQGLDISSPQILKQIMLTIGLDPGELDAIMTNSDYQAQVQADVTQANEFGLGGVPALVFEEKYLISGAQPYPTLAKAVEKIIGEQNE